MTGSAPLSLSQQAHRRLIGVLGFLLPFLLYLVAGVRNTTGLTPWQFLPSVSAYYYTGAVGIFVGVLFALSLFLITYQGYEGEHADRVLGTIGGASALGVALFPTTAPEGLSPASWWTPASRTVHYVSAFSLFVVFILFALWLFRKSGTPKKSARPVSKQWRDRVCLWCGLVMIAAVGSALTALKTGGPIFWSEAIAIMAFAISWLVKGEAYQPVVDGARYVKTMVAGTLLK